MKKTYHIFKNKIGVVHISKKTFTLHIKNICHKFFTLEPQNKVVPDQNQDYV